MAKGTIRIGCSGWVYADWRGRFYPRGLPQRRWFDHYATAFDTVELNATFYRLPTAQAVARWRDQAPSGFVYSVKLGQYATHRRKLREPASWLPNHLDRVRLLGPALGPTLVQLPPRWHRDVARLDDFLAAAPSEMRWAVELRDPTWLHDDTYAVLERHRAALCVHDLLEQHPWVRTTDFTYVRFHGPAARTHAYTGRYGGRRLWRPARRLVEWADDGVDAYVYFNNDYDAASVDDARWLRERVGLLSAPARRASP